MRTRRAVFDDLQKQGWWGGLRRTPGLKLMSSIQLIFLASVFALHLVRRDGLLDGIFLEHGLSVLCEDEPERKDYDIPAGKMANASNGPESGLKEVVKASTPSEDTAGGRGGRDAGTIGVSKSPSGPVSEHLKDSPYDLHIGDDFDWTTADGRFVRLPLPDGGLPDGKTSSTSSSSLNGPPPADRRDGTTDALLTTRLNEQRVLDRYVWARPAGPGPGGGDAAATEQTAAGPAGNCHDPSQPCVAHCVLGFASDLELGTAKAIRWRAVERSSTNHVTFAVFVLSGQTQIGLEGAGDAEGNLPGDAGKVRNSRPGVVVENPGEEWKTDLAAKLTALGADRFVGVVEDCDSRECVASQQVICPAKEWGGAGRGGRGWPTGGPYWTAEQNRTGLVSFMSVRAQHGRFASCLQLVEQWETEHKKRFDWVVKHRADTFYHRPWPRMVDLKFPKPWEGQHEHLPAAKNNHETATNTIPLPLLTREWSPHWGGIDVLFVAERSIVAVLIARLALDFRCHHFSDAQVLKDGLPLTPTSGCAGVPSGECVLAAWLLFHNVSILSFPWGFNPPGVKPAIRLYECRKFVLTKDDSCPADWDETTKQNIMCSNWRMAGEIAPPVELWRQNVGDGGGGGAGSCRPGYCQVVPEKGVCKAGACYELTGGTKKSSLQGGAPFREEVPTKLVCDGDKEATFLVGRLARSDPCVRGRGSTACT